MAHHRMESRVFFHQMTLSVHRGSTERLKNYQQIPRLHQTTVADGIDRDRYSFHLYSRGEFIGEFIG